MPTKPRRTRLPSRQVLARLIALWCWAFLVWVLLTWTLPMAQLLFGAAEGQRIVAEVRAGRDPVVKVPAHLLGDLRQEEEWEEENRPPLPRVAPAVTNEEDEPF